MDLYPPRGTITDDLSNLIRTIRCQDGDFFGAHLRVTVQLGFFEAQARHFDLDVDAVQ